MDTLLQQKLKDSGYIGELSLPSLLEACGDDFRWLKKRGHNEGAVWLAQGRPHPIEAKDIRCYGSTPTEAVARLWLKLNKK